MANQNFVVHNGLTVGPLTIDAATGDINTTGNVNISGSIGVSRIADEDSSIAITDTGANSTVVITIDGVKKANVNTSGMTLTGNLAVTNVAGITIAGAVAATLADATALSIALGG